MNVPNTDAVAAVDARVQRLNGYLAHDPDNTALLGELADLLLDAGRLDDARQPVATALAQAPDAPHFLYRLAVIEHAAGQLDRAFELLAGLVDRGVDEPAVNFLLARVQMARGQSQEAVVLLEKVAGSSLPEPLLSQAAFLQVRSLHELGDLDQAIAVAEAAANDPRRQQAPFGSALATLYLDADRMDDAARMYAQASEAGTLDAEVLAVGGYLSLGEADVAEAQQRFEASIASSPSMGRALLGLGLAHASQGDLAQACAVLERAAQSMPTHLGTWHALAWMQLLSKNLDAAQAAFDQALAVDRNFGDTYGGLAMVAALRGDRQGAEELMRTGRKLDPLSLNVGTARTLLQHGGSMENAEFLESALAMLHQQALSRDAGMNAVFEKLMKTRLRNPR